MRNKYLSLVEGGTRDDLPKFDVGDTVDVHVRILEGTKERVQLFSGTVIARRGEGGREMFTVRRIVQGEGVERIFPVVSPKIAKVEVKRGGQSRRAKLYYLRDRVGKATKLKERKSKLDIGSASSNGARKAKKARKPPPKPPRNRHIATPRPESSRGASKHSPRRLGSRRHRKWGDLCRPASPIGPSGAAGSAIGPSEPRPVSFAGFATASSPAMSISALANWTSSLSMVERWSSSKSVRPRAARSNGQPFRSMRSSSVNLPPPHSHFCKNTACLIAQPGST